MVRFMFGLFALAGLAMLKDNGQADAWGGKKGEDEPEMPKGKDAVDLARAGFRQVASGDLELMGDLLKDLEDPEVLKEVEKLMKDKKFKKEMDKLVSSDEWKDGYGEAVKLLSDPKAMEAIAKQTQDYTEYLAAGPGKNGRRDAAMGMGAGAASLMDPNFMKDAMEMMKDPEVMKQVEQTMKNPEFVKEMNRIKDTPEMKAALAKAGENMQEWMKDPALMAEAQRQMQAMMGGAAAA